jgi:hypothetical protein
MPQKITLSYRENAGETTKGKNKNPLRSEDAERENKKRKNWVTSYFAKASYDRPSAIAEKVLPCFEPSRKIGCDMLSFPGGLPVKLDVARRRIKSVIQNIVSVAGKLVRSGGYTKLKISARCPWLNPFERLFASYC